MLREAFGCISNADRVGILNGKAFGADTGGHNRYTTAQRLDGDEAESLNGARHEQHLRPRDRACKSNAIMMAIDPHPVSEV